MLRIRLPSGNIREFTGSEEFAQAVAAGEVGRDAEIYHAKSGRWVSVTGHPVFRRSGLETPAPPEAGTAPSTEALIIQSGAESLSVPQEASLPIRQEHADAVEIPPIDAPPTSKPRPEGAPEVESAAAPGGTDRMEPTPPLRIPDAEITSVPGPRSDIEQRREEPREPVRTPPRARPVTPRLPEAVPTPPPVLAIRSKSGEELAARRRSRWRVPVAVCIAASLLAGVLWMNRDRATDLPEPVVRPAPATPPSRPATQTVIPRDTGAPTPPPATPPPTLPMSVPPNALATNHARLADGLDSELTRTARQVGLNGLLAMERLASGDSVGASRAALTRFTASLATYRARQQALSKAYNDSADAFVLTGAWDRGALQEWQVRVRRPEPPAMVARADALIAGLDSLFGLLLQYQGGYEITTDAIRFQAPRASLQYDELLRAVNSNRVSQSEQLSTPLTVLSQAMAGSSLPRSAHD